MRNEPNYWDRIYANKAAHEVSWYRPHLETSLALIERCVPDRSAAIVDAGGGASTLVDDLLAKGYTGVTVLDISRTALDATQQRLGADAKRVQWIHADVTEWRPPVAAFDLWHDRAVFHFLVRAEDRRAYIDNVHTAVKPGGHVILATFGPQGPERCSGREVVRYSAESLSREFGPRFTLLYSSLEEHTTPVGAAQQFLYCCWERNDKEPLPRRH